MKANMAHFQEKIEEMQRKLNLINENIEQIKKGRKTYEENKVNDKTDDFFQNNIKKKSYLKKNTGTNFFNKKNAINTELNSMSSKMGKTCYNFKNSYSAINLLNKDTNNTQKNNGFLNSKLNLNNKPKYMDYSIENKKNETPACLRNTSNLKNSSVCLSNKYLKAGPFNQYLNKRKIRKTNSAGDINTSTSSKNCHLRYKILLRDKDNKNNEINNKNNSSIIDYNYSYKKENNINQNSIIGRRKNNYNNSCNNKSLNKENQRMRLMSSLVNYNCPHSIKHHKSSTTLENNNKKRYDISPISNNRTNNICSKCKNNDKNEKILFDIINATNEYNIGKFRKNRVDMDNILKEYKLILQNNKNNYEFISKLMKLYNRNNRRNLDINNYEYFETLLDWIKTNMDAKKERERENDEYKKLCMNIMREYNLENIGQLKIFIMKMKKKVNNNDNFLEGIKRILLP